MNSTETRPPPLFVADSVGIDFLNSVATPVDTPVDWLVDGDDLLAWLRAAQLAPDATLTKLKSASRMSELDAVAAQARKLREWFREFVKEHGGRSLKPAALAELEPLNRLLERDQQFSEVVVRQRGQESDSPSVFELRSQRDWRSPDSLLLPIAQSIADVICNEDFRYVKACEGSRCTLFFVDRTRSRARRWCSMALCGNRAKQSAHRERVKER